MDPKVTERCRAILDNKHAMHTTALSHKMVRFRGNLRPAEIDRVHENMIQDELEFELKCKGTTSTPLLDTLRSTLTQAPAAPQEESALSGLLKQQITAQNKQTEAFNKLSESITKLINP